MRGSNRYLPGDIAVQWCRFVPDALPLARQRQGPPLRLRAARVAGAAGARGRARRLDLPPASTATRCGRPAQALLGTHDFSAFRSAECQSPTPVKTLRALAIERRGDYWRFDFEADAFLHHMIRNIMGGLVAVGSGAPRSGLARPRCWPGGTGRSPPRPSRPTACTSSARTTMPPMRFPSERRPCRGFPEAAARPGARAMSARTRIKICGVSRPEDVAAAVDAGADAIGFVFHPGSPRYVTLDAGRGAGQGAAAVRDAGGPVRQRRAGDDRRRRRRHSGPGAAVPRRRDAGAMRRRRPAVPQGGADGAGLRFARLRAPFRRGPGPPPRRPCRGLRRQRKGLRLVARSSRRSPSARFVWWVACRKCRLRNPRAAALGR